MTVVVGGTFDHLHDGHKKLLARAASHNMPLIVGISTDTLLANKQYKEYIQGYQERKRNVEAFLDSYSVQSYKVQCCIFNCDCIDYSLG